jgi:5-formyltetrahydrofolate cyclo-ligase
MKKAIRREVLRKRDEIPPDLKTQKDYLIKERLYSTPEFTNARTVLFYASFRSEVDTLSMIQDSFHMGKRIVLPKVAAERHALILYEIKDVAELTSGYMGIPEPFAQDERLADLEEIDIIIVPGAGFDLSGNRLGYGAGYYDILLSNKKKDVAVIALAYEEQIVDSIPAEGHDVKMDMLVTEKRMLRIS